MMRVNLHAVRAIFRFEMSRWFRTIAQSILAPVVSTSLYFVVFGSAIGSRMSAVDGVSYGAFLVPGLAMLSILTQSISNASFGIYVTKWSGTIYELLSAPVSWIEAVIGYVGAAATKSTLLGLIIILTARAFVSFEIVHPVWMVAFLLLTAVTFSLFGFIIGVWADGFEKLQIMPLLIVTPPDVSRRQLLFDLDAAAALAEGHAAQPRRLSRQWLPLELLRAVGRRRRPEPRDDDGLPVDLPRHRLVDFPHRLQDQVLIVWVQPACLRVANAIARGDSTVLGIASRKMAGTVAIISGTSDAGRGRLKR